MKVYYLQNTDLGWDNVVRLATSEQKLIENYTGVVLTTQEEINKFLEDNPEYHINSCELNIEDDK